MEPAHTRLRITYTKNAVLRYTGHLDMQHLWERTLRRSHLPVAYSQGFHAQARIQQACALPLGFTSRCEMVDLWFDRPITLLEATRSLAASLPPGISMDRVEEIRPGEPALQTQVSAAEYIVTFIDPIDLEELRVKVQVILDSPEIPRTRRNKSYDLRPLIEALLLTKENDLGQVGLFMRLTAREAATGRPDEVLSAMGYRPDSARIERTRLILQ